MADGRSGKGKSGKSGNATDADTGEVPQVKIFADQDVDDLQGAEPADAATGWDQESQSFIGRWHQLVSTTNWEKGRIIYQWRTALEDAGAAAAEYSDDAWSQRVGGITGQHVGRLRRVYARFGQSYQEFQGLFWSHFQAALDWDDAEMWLEGALQSGWSVSQMRSQRWETLDDPDQQAPQDSDIVYAELDEDFEPALNAPPATSGGVDEHQGPRPEGPDFGDEFDGEEQMAAGEVTGGVDEPAAYVQPFQDLAELPEDLNDAFESFKLAILHHKSDGWREIRCEDVLATLDSLKQLAVAPG